MNTKGGHDLFPMLKATDSREETPSRLGEGATSVATGNNEEVRLPMPETIARVNTQN
jgi:hypothetical protein